MRKSDIKKLPKEALFQLSLQRGRNNCYTAHALYAQKLLQTDMFAKDELPKESGSLDYDLIDPDSFD